MSLSDSSASIEIRLTGAARLLLLLPLFVIAFGGWYATRWQLGNTVAEVVSTSETPDPDLARLAVRWAPDDPFVRWRLGELAQRSFTATGLQQMAREYETAVSLSPNDFRFWGELGRALEATGDRDNAKTALLRATELAPNYYYPRWHYGNVLLRSGDYAEAFPHLFRAAEANEQLWPQVFNLAWQAYDGDVDRIANEAGKDPRVRTIFGSYLVGVKQYDAALRLWKSISAEKRREFFVSGRVLRNAFINAAQFRAALEVHRDIEPPSDDSPAPHTFSDGGFEGLASLPVSRPFGWTIGSNVQAQMSISNQARTGRHSLQIVLRAASRLERINALQTIVVEPNTQYSFECYARTEKLTSASTPVVVILDGANNEPITYSTPLPSGTNNWQKISLDFKTRASDGIIVMIGRLPCAVGDVCPIFGTVWYDDFSLQSRGGRDSGGARRANTANSI